MNPLWGEAASKCHGVNGLDGLKTSPHDEVAGRLTPKGFVRDFFREGAVGWMARRSQLGSKRNRMLNLGKMNLINYEVINQDYQCN
jgi:hypothetical protein